MAADPAPKLWRRLTSPGPSPGPSPKSRTDGLDPLPSLLKQLQAFGSLQRGGSGLGAGANQAGGDGTHGIRAYHGVPPNASATSAAAAAAPSQHDHSCTHSPAEAAGAGHAASDALPLRTVSMNSINSPRALASELAQLQPRRRPPPPLITLPADLPPAGSCIPANHSPAAAGEAAAAQQLQQSPKPRRLPPPPPVAYGAAAGEASAAAVAQRLRQAEQPEQLRLPPQQERAHLYTRLS